MLYLIKVLNINSYFYTLKCVYNFEIDFIKEFNNIYNLSNNNSGKIYDV